MTAPRIAASVQGQKFIATARALECNEDEDAFKRALRKVAKAPKPPKAEDSA